jgi:hypothetical protein
MSALKRQRLAKERAERPSQMSALQKQRLAGEFVAAGALGLQNGSCKELQSTWALIFFYFTFHSPYHLSYLFALLPFLLAEKEDKPHHD